MWTIEFVRRIKLKCFEYMLYDKAPPTLLCDLIVLQS